MSIAHSAKGIAQRVRHKEQRVKSKGLRAKGNEE